MGIKYVRNTDDATIVCKIPSDKSKVFIFKPKKIDKRNNVVLSNGFTAVTEEDLKLLRAESSTFIYYENAKRLTLTDVLPQEAMSSDQLIDSLRTENAILKEQIAANRGNEKLAELQKALQNALVTIDEQEKMIAEKAAVIEEQEKTMVALEEQVAVLSEEQASDTEEKE